MIRFTAWSFTTANWRGSLAYSHLLCRAITLPIALTRHILAQSKNKPDGVLSLFGAKENFLWDERFFQLTSTALQYYDPPSGTPEHKRAARGRATPTIARAAAFSRFAVLVYWVLVGWEGERE